MNHVYRLIWNELTATYVVTPKTARSRGKRNRAVKALAVVAALGIFTQAKAEPTGGQISAGTGSINQQAAVTTISQSSQKLAINWNSFNVGASETVNFVQPNRSAIALNRVLGTDGTQILGKLNANGQVFILNPNGVLFGKGAQVNVGGLVASTLRLSDSDFLAGKYSFSGTGGKVSNEGSITAADGGYVALIGNQVSNQGTIVAKLGTVALAAGQQVSLDFAGDGLLKLNVDQAAVDALVTNKGLIQADGGLALMTAHAKDALLNTVVNNEGIVRARTVENHSGVIKLLGNMDSGTVKVAGTLDASAPNGGDGGFIDTSGAHVAIDPNATVTTLAPYGKTGNWLIDPPDFKIAASGGDMTGTYLSGQLNQTNMTILSSSGGLGANGDILVNDAVSWTANTTLTLSAHRNIEVNADITATGNTAGLVLTPGTGTTGDYILNSVAKIMLSGSTPILTIAGQTYIVINDINALQAMNNNLAGYYALGSDIDASATSGWNGGAGFVPIGVATSWSSITGANSVEDILVVLASNWSGNTHFVNMFTGLGHVITNLSINRPASNSVGLFGSAGPNSLIRDVGLVNSSVVGSTYIGGLVGWNYGVIKDSFVSGTITTGDAPHTGNNNQYVGGLIGYNWGHVRNSRTAGSIYGSNQYVGGLIGLNQGYISASLGTLGSVSNSWSFADVSGGGHLGGLIGNNWGVISKSFATGNVTGSTSSIYLGGLIGSNWNNVNNSYATGNVTSGATSQLVGGLMGDSQNSLTTVSNSYSTGLVSVGAGSTSVGGLVGHNTGTFSNSYWDTQTSGQTTSAGGIGLTSAPMKSIGSFTGWDISSASGGSSIWKINDGVTTPYLRSFLIPLAISAVASDSKTYDGSTYSGGNGYTASGADGSKIMYIGSSQGARDAGNYSIRLYSLSYDLSGNLSNTLIISPNNLAITASNASKIYGDTLNFTGSEFASSGLQNNETIDSVSLSSSGATATASVTGGPYVITPNNATGSTFNPTNYNISYVNGTLTITPAPLTVTADDKTKIQTQPNPPLSATYTGFKLGQNASVLSGSLLLATTAVKDSAAGNYPITASGQTSTNYSISYVDGKLKVLASLEPENHGEPEHAFGNAIAIAHSGDNTDVSGGRNAGGTRGGNSINNGGNGPDIPPVTNDNSPAALIVGLPLAIEVASFALPTAEQLRLADRPEPPAIPNASRSSVGEIRQTSALTTLTSDGSGAFPVYVLPKSSAVMPDAIQVLRPVGDVVITPGSALNIPVPHDAFVHTSADAKVSLSATQASGLPLPSWLRFDSALGTFSGIAPPGFSSVMAIRVIARDQTGRMASSSFKVSVNRSAER